MSVTRSCPRCGYRHTYATEATAAANHPRHSCAREEQRMQACRRRAERAAGTGKRDCRHPGQPHSHGNRVTYVKDRCRCTECTAANTEQWRAAGRAHALGRPSPHVDAAPVRDHIGVLRCAGIGYERIARLAEEVIVHLRSHVETERSRCRLHKLVADITPLAGATRSGPGY